MIFQPGVGGTGGISVLEEGTATIKSTSVSLMVGGGTGKLAIISVLSASGTNFSSDGYKSAVLLPGSVGAAADPTIGTVNVSFLGNGKQIDLKATDGPTSGVEIKYLVLG